MPCLICKQIRDTQDEDFELQEATRVISWETAGSPMVPVCDRHAFAMAKEKFVDHDGLRIDTIDNAMNTEEVFYD